MRGVFALFILSIMFIAGSATVALMLYLFGVIGE